MGATIYVHWPHCRTADEAEHPGFGQDDSGYAHWIGLVQSDKPLMERISNSPVQPLFAVGSSGQRESAMTYTTPLELCAATESLRAQIRDGTALALALVAKYTRGPGEHPPAVELSCDLEDVSNIATYAADRGAKQVTLLISW